jgi:Na+-transporting NADH:ubiquinone oxidoreductase subunit NqrC
MKKSKKYILIVVLGALAVSSIFMTVVTATSGAEVSSLQKEEKQLADQKRFLEDALVKTLSMDQLQEKSGSMGYVKPVNLVYVAPPEAVAKLP